MFFLFGIEKIGSLFNKKLRKRQKGIVAQQSCYNVDQAKRFGKVVVWSHCSSLGEFEQARSVLKLLKDSHEDIYIIQSFYSSSGYENCNRSLVDEMYYLPNDVIQSRSFLKTISPDIVIWCKYDFWFHYFELLNSKSIPLIFYSTIFGDDHWLFKFWSHFFLKTITSSRAIITQDQDSYNRLINRNYQNIVFAGDTRIDGVLYRKQSSQPDERLRLFINAKKTLIIASSHQEDVEVIDKLIQLDSFQKILIFPHEVKGKHLNHLVSQFPNASIWSNDKPLNGQIAIIDTVGLLFDSYSMASMVYVGGGFGSGVHNTLEPAVFGKPILVGPKYKKFPEIIEFINRGICYPIEHLEDISNAIQHFNKNTTIIEKLASSYFETHKGASGIVVESIIQNIPK